MTLPKVYAPIEPVTIGGEQFECRVLTRAETARFQKMAAAGAPLDDQEIMVIACSTDTTLDETRAWYEAAPTWAAQQLMDHIVKISRLEEEAQKRGSGSDRTGPG